MRAHPRAAAHARACIALLAYALSGCRADGPTGVPGASAYAPLAAYPLWWSLVESCSGLQGDYAAVRWARVAGTSIPGSGGEAQGQWASATNTITLVATATTDPTLVRHEMLHALLGARGGTGHPAAYFGVRCGGYVVCAGPCETEVAAATPTPADAPAVRADDLIVTARLVTLPSGSRATGGAFALVVTAQNPTPVAGWVVRSTNPSVSEAPDFGYTLSTPLLPGVPLGALHAAPGARTYFGAGETQAHVFDVTASDFVPGAYALGGTFAGTRSAPAAVALPP